MPEQAEKKKRKTSRPIPRHSLEEALKVASAIQDGNNGKPWKPIFVADYLQVSKTSSNFRDLTSSAYKYGLTTSTWNAKSIGLTELGQTLTKPLEPSQEVLDRQVAVLNIPILKHIYEHYRKGKLPSGDNGYFRNSLETQFKVPKAYVDECMRLLEENGRFAGILFESQGSLWVTFDNAATTRDSTIESEVADSYSDLASGTSKASESKSESGISPPIKPPKRNQIFIVHGKNRTPMKQLKAILEKFKIPYKVAIDEPHKGRPISKKVADLMRDCTSAIIIFTADEAYTNTEGIEVWRPSDNAVYELGAASILYDKIVILKEKDVTLASDFSDIGYISFEKDALEAKTMQLITEFVGMGFVKITPT